MQYSHMKQSHSKLHHSKDFDPKQKIKVKVYGKEQRIKQDKNNSDCD